MNLERIVKDLIGSVGRGLQADTVRCWGAECNFRSFVIKKRAREFVSSIGVQYFHRYLIWYWEWWLKKSICIDVINIESSIASYYFYKLYRHQFDFLVNQYDCLALANVGFSSAATFSANFPFFGQARRELILRDTMLTPEYVSGWSFQTSQYLTKNFSYGVYKREMNWSFIPGSLCN